MPKIKRAAVLGAGVMGTGIAAHLAGAGIDTILLDIVPRELTDEDRARGLTEQDPRFRNKLALGALARAKKAKPAVYYNADDADLIRAGNLEDDLALLGECDWIVEAVTERLDIKRSLFEKVDAHRRPGALVTSNTSGLRIAEMVAGRSDDFRRCFFVTHFFNPVRYMRLLELVAGDETDPDAVQAMARFGADVLGKGVVFGKDTPNFVANRIGTYAMLYTLHAMVREGFTVEEIDAVFGPVSGRPKSAVFRTADIVGLDTFKHVADNCHASLTGDESRDTFKTPAFLDRMIDKGLLGQKTRAGFYKKEGKEILALDLETLTYRPKQKVRADSIGAARKIEDVRERVRAFVMKGEDRYAKLAWEVTAHTLTYAARRLGEIADDIVNVDNAMKWGFNWDLGPFETWDAIGLPESVARMEAEGIEVPGNIKELLAGGVTSFYGGTAARPTYIDIVGSKEPRPIPQDPRHIRLAALREEKRVVEENPGATLFDIGDDILLLEFHTKMNAIDDDVIGMLHRAVDLAEARYQGLVIANEHKDAFSVGANLFAVVMAVNQQQWDALEKMAQSFQQATLRLRTSDIPVVAAPAGLALGGGAEVTMGADAVRAHAETYMGLVEVGVGLIPGGGGTLELLERFCGNLPDDPAFDPMPFIRRAFELIAMAKVCMGAEDGRRLGMLRPQDGVTLNRDLLIHDAKQAALGMARAGYRKPRPLRFRLPGPDGAAAFRWFADSMRQGGHISDHDYLIASKLAWVLCGGETTTRRKVSQQEILDLEREAFLSLAGEPKTVARMQHMLMKNKPLRN